MADQEEREEIAERLADALGERMLTQRSLAEHLELTEAAVSKWIKQGVPESWVQIREVARYLGVSVDSLLGIGDGVGAAAAALEQALRQTWGDEYERRILEVTEEALRTSEASLKTFFGENYMRKGEELRDLMVRTAAVFAGSPDSIPERFGFELEEPDGARREFLQIPLMSSEVCAGPGAEMTDEIEGWHAMRLDWVAGHVLHKPVRLRVARSHVGESMSNTILPGAILTVDLGPVEEVTPGAIYIVQDENAGVMVKRVYPLPEEGSFLCMSDNRAFPPFRIREDEGGRLLGRVLRWEQGEDNGPTV